MWMSAIANFSSGERTPEGFFRVRAGLDQAIARAQSYAPFADMIWCETSEPNWRKQNDSPRTCTQSFLNKLLAYNCSPSFNWRKQLDGTSIAKFQRSSARWAYKFQFVTLAGFHALNASMFNLARDYRDHGMAAYAVLQERNSPPNAMVTRRQNINAKSAPVTSISSPKLSPTAKARRLRWTARPKRNSSE